MGLPRSAIEELVAGYGAKPWVATLGSHSALDIADGAAAESLPTLVLAQRGREKTYAQYFRTVRGANGERTRGCVDEVWTFDRFAEVAEERHQERLRSQPALLIPNRALSAYLPLDVIEEELRVPIVGSRSLLRIEERSERENYYTLLAEAGIPIPERIPSPAEIDGLVIVKLPHATRRLERGFFTVASPKEFETKRQQLLAQHVVTEEDLATARIERYVVGPVFNFNFFFSPLVPRADGLELLGVDERRESSLDGLVRLPAAQQLEMDAAQRIPRYTVVGHASLTVRESILEEVFHQGEQFVDATRRRFPPGILGPFCLQTCLDAEGRPTVFDVAARIGGGTNIHLGIGHAYGNALWREPMSSGRRLAVEIRRAIAGSRLAEILT